MTRLALGRSSSDDEIREAVAAWVEAHVPAFGHADREVLARFVDHTHGLEALAGEVVSADLGQDAPDPVGETEVSFTTSGPVLEVFDRVFVDDRLVAREALEQIQAEQGDEYEECDRNDAPPFAFVCVGLVGLHKPVPIKIRL